jgi:hypothetical protein
MTEAAGYRPRPCGFCPAGTNGAPAKRDAALERLKFPLIRRITVHPKALSPLRSAGAVQSLNWSPVEQPPYIIANHYYVADGVATNASKFYRLRCTNCMSGSLTP